MALTENKVEHYVIKYLKNKGFEKINKKKNKHGHGADIIAVNKIWRKKYIIEAKGSSDSKTSQEAIKHNSIYTVLGQILCRMKKTAGNSNNQSIYYAIALPKTWEHNLKKKVKEMAAVWKMLKLKVFLVNNNGIVEEKTYLHFLKKGD